MIICLVFPCIRSHKSWVSKKKNSNDPLLKQSNREINWRRWLRPLFVQLADAYWSYQDAHWPIYQVNGVQVTITIKWDHVHINSTANTLITSPLSPSQIKPCFLWQRCFLFKQASGHIAGSAIKQESPTVSVKLDLVLVFSIIIEENDGVIFKRHEHVFFLLLPFPLCRFLPAWLTAGERWASGFVLKGEPTPCLINDGHL